MDVVDVKIKNAIEYAPAPGMPPTLSQAASPLVLGLRLPPLRRLRW